MQETLGIEVRSLDNAKQLWSAFRNGYIVKRHGYNWRVADVIDYDIVTYATLVRNLDPLYEVDIMAWDGALMAGRIDG